LRKQQHFGLHGLAAFAQYMPRLFPLAAIQGSTARHRKTPSLVSGARNAPC
jgi:hypothetical protein